MFNNLKNKIRELAKKAVVHAERTLGDAAGQKKKEMAVKFIVEKIPVPDVLKSLIAVVFSSFIDEAIELAVEYMKKRGNIYE